MPVIQFLDHDRILELVRALADAGLITNETLDALLSGLPWTYVASLPRSDKPLNRVMLTLDDLNRIVRLVDGTVPFRSWLRNASLHAANKPEPLDVINRALSDVNRQVSGAALPPLGFDAVAPKHEERIVGTSDLLPFDFLRRGAEAGRAVARLEVRRYRNGKQELIDGNPLTYLGTGWLLTPSLLITNHHVLDARDLGEPIASPDDLSLQALSAEVKFDYESAGTSITPAKVAGLEAFAPVGGPLDYAILRLERAVDRRPLTIVKSPMSLPPGRDRYPSVNIIQHPEGNPKMVACRNNLVAGVHDAQIWYFTDTMGGSSGSPVLDDEWRVVAIHKRWDYVSGVRYQGRHTAWANQGTQMFAIIDHLRASGKTALLAEMGLD